MSDKKISKTEQLINMCRAVAHLENAGIRRLNSKFYVTEPAPGVRRLLRGGENDTVHYCDWEGLTGAVQSHIIEMDGKDWEWTGRKCEEFTKFFRRTATPIPEPYPMLMKSEKGLTFHRLDWDAEGGECPNFNEFLGRCTNAVALQGWIGSLFIKAADRQQYVYMYGSGQNGKSALLRFLSEIFGPACTSKETPKRDDRFWNANLPGKRLVIMPDCGNAKFPASQMFKMLTGADMVNIERKGENPYESVLNAKFIFASNDKLEIKPSKADLRRAIYCEVQPIKCTPDPRYQEWLRNEAPHIAYQCIGMYHRLCPKDGPIPCNGEAIAQLAFDNYAEFDMYFDDNFSDDGNEGAALKDRPYFTIKDLAQFCKWAKIDRKEFEGWLLSAKKLEQQVVNLGNNKSQRRYVGYAMIAKVKQTMKSSYP